MAQPVTNSRRIPVLPAFSAWIAEEPCRAFGAFAVLHLVIWTALPTLLYPNLPLDLIEALIYGREWQLGYDKLPPLPWWLVEIAYRAVGRDFAYYALGQIAVLSGLAFVWAMARPIAGPQGALAAVLIADGLHYLNYTAAKFNHDVIQLPFWGMAGFALHRALRGGGLIHWCPLGAAVGLALWAKYFAVMLAAPIVLFMLLDGDARKTLATPGPWLALIVALAVMAPHLVWLVQNDFLPFGHVSARAAMPRGLFDHVLHPLVFAAGQAGFLVPAFLIALPLFWPRTARNDEATLQSFDFRIVTLLAFGPAAAMVALSAISGRGTVAMWGYPLWLFIGLWLVMLTSRTTRTDRLPRIAGTWAIVLAGFMIAFIANYAVLPRIDHRYRAAFFPGESMAREISQRYRAVTQRPLIYVIGSMWDGGNVSHYTPERPRVLIDGRPERAPWIDLTDLRSKGAVILWTEGDLRTLPLAFRRFVDTALVQDPFEVPFRNSERNLGVGWAVLPPRPAFAQR